MAVGQRGLEADPAEHARRHGNHAGIGVELSAARGDPHGAVAPLDSLDGRAEPDRVAEPLRQPERQPLVPAGHARGRLLVDVRDAGEVARRHLFSRARARDLDACQERLAHAGVDLQPVEELLRAQLRRDAVERALDTRHRGGHPLVRRRRAAARLAAPVCHALVAELETEPRRQLADGGIARAGCTRRPSRRRRRLGAGATRRARRRARAPRARPPRRPHSGARRPRSGRPARRRRRRPSS